MTCLILDDYELSRLMLEGLVEKEAGLELSASLEDPYEAIRLINEKKIEIAFLDIEMPEMSGIELLQHLEHKPVVVFITGQTGYQNEPIKYDRPVYFIIKPIAYNNFKEVIEKIDENE